MTTGWLGSGTGEKVKDPKTNDPQEIPWVSDILRILKKDPKILNAAYNDKAGMNAAFNLNLLARINRELGGDFDLDRFAHVAFYNEAQGRVELYVKSLTEQTVTVKIGRAHV